MAKIKINSQRCKACGLCIIYCPNGSIVFSDNINKQGVKPARFKEGAKCAGCAFCVMMCPDCAIELCLDNDSEEGKNEKR
ncbi:MAG: 4Fe-4S binding protein [Candidatus Omnitrophica bacterium]|nr:4Fe-4S binding protein [Candidatus Omnitrophota bacterium]